MNKVFSSQSVVNLAVSDQWIVIDSDVTLTANVTMGENVVIEFQGGRILSHVDVHITGTYTKVVAPITQIFGDNIICDGMWILDRAYPQWFTSQNYNYPLTIGNGELAFDNNTNINADWAPAINKAINMKLTGEVFIPHGLYFIKSSINVTHGIILRGESGKEGISSSGKMAFGTILLPSDVCSRNSFYDGYMILINKSSGATWEFEYPQTITKICDLMLRNKYSESNQIYGLSGIQAYGGAIVDTVRFWRLYCGVQFTGAEDPGIYSDDRQVVNCLFDAGTIVQGNDAPIFYAFDFNFLGDALLFRSNHVISINPEVKGLKIFFSCGGVVESNIINSDVLISKSKSIVFEGNHLEGGTQLKILSSAVSVISNFFERKGSKSAVCLCGDIYGHNSVVLLQNNQYCYYEDKQNYSVEEVINRILSTSDYDISIDPYTIVDIRNEYRYLINEVGVTNMFVFGVQIEKMVYSGEDLIPDPSSPDLSVFNNLSHHLSRECHISAHNLVHGSFPPVTTTANIGDFQLTSNITWLDVSGKFRYQVSTCDENGNIVYTRPLSGLFTLIKSGSGILMQVSGVCSVSLREIRLVINRYKYNSAGTSIMETKSVVVNICGSVFLFDNGISICGYKWT